MSERKAVLKIGSRVSVDADDGTYRGRVVGRQRGECLSGGGDRCRARRRRLSHHTEGSNRDREQSWPPLLHKHPILWEGRGEMNRNDPFISTCKAAINLLIGMAAGAAGWHFLGFYYWLLIGVAISIASVRFLRRLWS